jgi:MOSC domain-containing protein YiiM
MVTFKPLPDFPKYALTSDCRILHNTGHGFRKAVVKKDKSGFRYVILSNGEIEKKMFLLALKFPRGEGYENVLHLKKKEEKKLKELREEDRRLGRHHRSLNELRRSMQKHWKAIQIEP